jgi:ribosomal protein L11 methyltransferase
LIRLAVRVRREQAELVLAELLSLAPSGVEEVDLSPDVVEYAVYGAPGELPALPDLHASAGRALVEVATSTVADDWAQRWREFHRPVVVGDGRIAVRPPWEEAGSAEIDLVIDPGQAFGTGAHATTRLCLELMLELEPAGSFVDLGCGSGVLAIAAGRLGYSPVVGLDFDPASVIVTGENALANGVEVSVRRFDLRSSEEAVPAARTVAANLLGPLLQEWAGRLAAVGGAVPERLIASGLLVAEGDGISAAFGAAGLREVRRLESGEWAALLLVR